MDAKVPGAKTADAGKDAAKPQTPADAATTARAPAPARMAPLPPAVELAGCLAAAGQVPEALAVIDRVGTDFTDAYRVKEE